MENEMKKMVQCEECKKVLDPSYGNERASDPCPFCGSIKKLVTISLQESIDLNLHERIEMKIKQKGKKKNRKEIIDGDEINHADGKWINKNRIIDREKNQYYEKVQNKDGTLIHLCNEKLTQHMGHGSAKKDKK